MPCLPVPQLPAINLPSPLSLAPPATPTPTITIASPCCTQPLYTATVPGLPFPPLAVNPAVVAAIKVALQEAEAFIDSLALHCSRDP